MKCRDEVDPKKTVNSKTQNYIRISNAVMHSAQIYTSEMMNNWLVRLFAKALLNVKFTEHFHFSFSNNVILCI